METTESGGPRGFDAGKKITGRKRHILTDTGGLLVAAHVTRQRAPQRAPHAWEGVRRRVAA